jgi:hypothetical protein
VNRLWEMRRASLDGIAVCGHLRLTAPCPVRYPKESGTDRARDLLYLLS